MAKSRHVPGPDAARVEVAIKSMGALRARVGWFESSKYPDGTPAAYVAMIQENGYGPIPPRPFFAPTVEASKGDWQRIAEGASRQMLKGALTAEGALEMLGLQAEGDVRKTISQITEPQLGKRTLKARKRRSNASEKPLVDTRYMINTLTSVVDSK